ncbi:DUF1772 domain-containing protein [Chitinophaga sp. sic0106]|uniref:anthrone oxygenase family protein n=1 Tax=Chitinophaga sp. sic0106 TaxID=2854785 RepID=UPI001C45B80E|nr:DUF1772 domain-containing protein [Chitinophaga sp. sic0106]MBV7533713.1 DUF1772 domain-containing protein [Chitinophaga sp. sic0106]
MKIITIILLGLITGIFYCWSVSVTRGLALLPDKAYILAFQKLNQAIQNPLFFICFFGPLILLPVCVWRNFSIWLLLATLSYYIGVMGVTIVGNIPLNNMLEAFSVQGAGTEELRQMRAQFEGRWNTLNHIRTLCSLGSFVLTLIAMR